MRDATYACCNYHTYQSLAWPYLGLGFSLQKAQSASHVWFVLNIVTMALICLPGIPFDTVNHASYSVMSPGGRTNGPLEPLVSEDVPSTYPRNNIKKGREKNKIETPMILATSINFVTLKIQENCVCLCVCLCMCVCVCVCVWGLAHVLATDSNET